MKQALPLRTENYRALMRLTAFAGFSVYMFFSLFYVDKDTHGIYVLIMMVLFLLALGSAFRIIGFLIFGIDRKFASSLWFASNTVLTAFYTPKGKISNIIWFAIAASLVCGPLIILLLFEDTRDFWGIFAFFSCYGLHTFWGLLARRAENNILKSKLD